MIPTRTTIHLGSSKGNAVTLTLLGLAVAILAGVAVLYYMGKQRPVPVPVEIPSETEELQVMVSNPRDGWSKYESTEYGFSFEYPPDWLVEASTVFDVPVITAYDPAVVPADVGTTTVSSPHERPTRVSVYPTGLPVGGTGDQEESGVLDIAGASTTRYVLHNSGESWATILRFSALPKGWTEDGYVIARVQITDETVNFVRGTDTMITAEEYDPFVGDRIVRDGFVSSAARERTDEILRSFSAIAPKANDSTRVGDTADLIRVTAPLANEVVTSPVHIRGEARGTWFFEGSFPVELRTINGDVLSSTIATTSGEWMTEEFVPFESVVTFAHGTATSGMLVLKRDNPSGMPEHERSLEIPIAF